MDDLKRFKNLAEIYGEETEVYIELEDGRIVEVFGLQPVTEKGALIIKLSPKPHDYSSYLKDGEWNG